VSNKISRKYLTGLDAWINDILPNRVSMPAKERSVFRGWSLLQIFSVLFTWVS